MVRSCVTAHFGIGIVLLLPLTAKLLATEPLAKTPDQSEVASPEDSARNLVLAKKSLDEGLRLYGRQDGASAIPHLEQSLVLFEEAIGPRDIRTIFVLQVLAKVHTDQRHYANARQYIEEVIVRAGTHSQARLDIKFAALWELGRVDLRAKSNEQAEKNLEEARALKLDVRKERDLDAARLLYDLATAQQRLGRRDDAQRTLVSAWDTYTTAPGNTLDRACAIANEHRGNSQIETANLLRTHGQVLALTGKPSVAEPMLDRAAKILKQRSPPRHPYLARVLLASARVHLQTGHYAKAETESEEAIKICAERFGDQHRKTAEAVDVFGQVLLAKEDYDRAEQHFKRALAIREKSLDDSHPDTAESWFHLALLAVERNSLETALQQLEKSLAIREASLREGHPTTLETRKKIEEVESLIADNLDQSASKPQRK